MTAPGVRISVMGPLRVHVDGNPVALGGDLQRRVLAVLVAERPGSVSVDGVLHAVWGPEVDPKRKESLHTYVSNLRSLGLSIERRGSTYRLDHPTGAVDAERLAADLDEARSILTENPERASSLLRASLAETVGSPYEDLIDFEWLDDARGTLEALRLDAVTTRLEADLAAGRHGEVWREIGALADEYPEREDIRGLHALALYRAGQQTTALSALDAHEDYMRDRLGMSIDPELVALRTRILQQDDTLTLSRSGGLTEHLAILCSDIEGSTELWDRDRDAMMANLARHDAIVQEVVAAEHGHVFKHMGDGVLAAFPTAIGGMRAAEQMVRRLESEEWGDRMAIRVRVGVDVGEVQGRDGDFFGPPVNRAARISDLGHGGQVLVSERVSEAWQRAEMEGTRLHNLGEHPMKGFPAPEPVFQLVFVGLQADFPPLRMGKVDGDGVISVQGFEVRERIGRGAFGVVHRAYQPSVGREVAIKMIRREYSNEPGFVRRFEAEAKTIAALDHPHIVSIIDHFRDDKGAYIVLPLMVGSSLHDQMEMARVDTRSALRILRQVAEALDHAHGRGILHGDLKPSNVLLDGSGNAFLSDFGIPSRLVQVDGETRWPSSAPEYRAPELAPGEASRSGDLYSFGRLVLDLLGEADQAVPDVVARAMAREPSDRFASASACLSEVEEAVGEVDERVAPSVSRNPFKGLSAFSEDDAADFFGRDTLLESILATVGSRRLVAVTGASGSGKSSAVHAGAVPRLRKGAVPGSDSWFIVTMTPGQFPTVRLAERLVSLASQEGDLAALLAEGGLAGAADWLLGDAEGDLLLIVDQFEELYTQTGEERRKDFLDLLSEAAWAEGSRVRILLTLRADFFDRPLAHPGIGQLVSEGMVTVLPPGKDDLVDIISKPATAVGLRWQPGLPHRIADEIDEEPGGLPLLQYALTELVERRTGNLLTADDYDRIGGVTGALDLRAEAILASLEPEARAAARQIFLRLVTVDESSDDTRRRVEYAELERIGLPRSVVASVVDAFAQARLLTRDKHQSTRAPTVEVSHEALLREWARLRGWIEERRDDLVLQRKLRDAFAEWDRADRHDDYLLTGERLSPFLTWLDAADLSIEERDFVDRSRLHDEAIRSAERRRRRILVSVLSAAAVISLAFGVFALQQRGIAVDEADRANTLAEEQVVLREEADASAAEAVANAQLATEAQAEAEAQAAIALENEAAAVAAEEQARADALAAFALASLDEDPELSLLLGVEALRTADSDVAVEVLHEGLQLHRTLFQSDFYQPPVRHIFDGALSPDGSLIAGGGLGQPTWAVWDRETGDQLWELRFPPFTVSSISFDTTGEYVVAVITVSGLEVAPEGTFDRVVVAAARSGRIEREIEIPPCDIPFGGNVLPSLVDLGSSVAWAVYSDCDRGAVTVGTLDLSDGRFTGVAEVGNTFVGVPTMDASGDRFAYAQGSPGAVIDLSTGAVLRRLPRGLSTLSPDGTRVVVGNDDLGEIALVEVATGRYVWSFPVAMQRVWFSSSGRLLHGAGEDGTIWVLQAETGAVVSSLTGLGGEVRSTSMGLDESELLSFAGTRARISDVSLGMVSEVPISSMSSLEARTQSVSAADGVVALVLQDRSVAQYQVEVLHPLEGGTRFTIPGYAATVIPGGELVAVQVIKGRTVVGTESDTLRLGDVVLLDSLTGLERARLEMACDAFVAGGGIGASLSSECPDGALSFVARSLVASADGSRLAVLSETNEVHVFDLVSGELVGSFAAAASQGAFDPTGRFLLLAGADGGDLFVLDLDAGGVIGGIHLSGSGRVAVTPDGSRMVVQSEGGAVSIVDLGRLAEQIAWSQGQDPDDPVVQNSADWRSGVGVFVLEEGVRLLDAHPGVGVLDLSLSEGLLATGGGDGRVRVWDFEAGRQVFEAPFAVDQVTNVAWLDDSHLFVTGSGGSSAVLTLDRRELLEVVLARISRAFTEQECATYPIEDCPTSLLEMRREATP